MSRRDQIQMSDEEVWTFLDQERTVVCATIGKDGWPHLMPLWYVVRDGTVWAWTFAKSQKIRNLERDPRATIQVEAGTEYDQLRGVMFKCEVKLHTDLDVVLGVGVDVLQRYAGGAVFDEGAKEMVKLQAAKRVGLEFVERERATWDHSKLGGVY